MNSLQSIFEVVASLGGKMCGAAHIHREFQYRARLSVESLEDRCVPATASRLGVTLMVNGKIMVQALDSQNNLVTNFTGTVHFSTADSTAKVPPDYTFTANDLGVALLPGLALGKKKLPITVSQVSRPSVTGSMQAGVFGFGGQLTLTFGAPQGVKPGVPFSVTLSHANLAGMSYAGTVHFESSDPDAILPEDYTFTPYDLTQAANFRRHPFTSLVLNTPGPQTIYITEITKNESFSIPVAVGAYFSTSTNLSSDIAKAGQTFQLSTKAMLDGLVTPGYRGEVTFISSDPLAVLPKNYQFKSQDNGVKAFPITMRTPGDQIVQMVDTVTNEIQGTIYLQVVPGPVSKFIVAAPSKVPGSSSYTMKIIPVDAFNNYVSTYRGPVSIYSSDSQAGLPDSYTFQVSQGPQSFTVNSDRPRGQQIVRVYDQANKKLSGQAIVNLIEKPALKVTSPKLNTPVSTSLNDTQVASILAEALQRWQTAGVDVSSLQGVQVRTMNFGDRQTVAQSAGNTIWLDDNAAGWGWFVDSTPSDNAEFLRPLTPGVYNRIDLLTAMTHEIGHMLGINDTNQGVMSRTIAPGKRSSPK